MKVWPGACVALTATLVAAATLGPSPQARAASICPGAAVPAGFAIDNGVPYVPDSDVGARYSPQTIALFVAAVWGEGRGTTAQRTCLARWAAGVLIHGSRQVPFTDARGGRRVARLYPYPYAFSANPSQATLRSGWVSGLGQASALSMLADLADRTRDRGYLALARQTFDSFLLPAGRGGFVTRHAGLTYLQEYVTSVPSYVLNGHDQATVSLVHWARRTHDADARDLARQALAALHTTTALEQISFPTGLASSYDLLRGWPAAPLRVLASGRLTVHSAAVVDARGARLGGVRLPVATSAPPPPNQLSGPGFDRWRGGTPAGWTVAGAPASGAVTRGSAPGAVRLTSTGRGTVLLSQDLAPVTSSTAYALSWRARVVPRRGVATSPGAVLLQAVCDDKITTVAAADVRGRDRAVESITGTVPRRCTPRALFYQADPSLPSAVEYSDVRLAVADPLGSAVAPRYPISVLETPTVRIKVTYTGGGRLQGWMGGRWSTIDALPAGTRRTAITGVPAWMQGRTVNLRYHNAHVKEFTALYELTGDVVLRRRALTWLEYAPADEPLRAQLRRRVPVRPV